MWHQPLVALFDAKNTALRVGFGPVGIIRRIVRGIVMTRISAKMRVQIKGQSGWINGKV